MDRKMISRNRFYYVTCVLFALTAAAAWAQAASDDASPSQQEILPTGMIITPTAANGSSFVALSPGLPELPQFTADHPVTTALSPDGRTLLVLTSGYNRNSDSQGQRSPALSNEYVFVYDVHQPRPVKKQVLKVPNTF